ncbi:hypothetical protein [Azospirillum picis]|uniref:Uncharacterized protein n=1 Tax=Azospirillum picis TaxID=488438 RepID=A0ABU0MRZ8_9PROT|nr:hypothetical protein [Azospirillum picis]MBP2302500.1 hypothetical protein [Azospirillum picis]MDQ0536258.1 hypothetical protein [Azospirillum picis]
MTQIGTYATVKGTPFSVETLGDRFIAVIADRRVTFCEIEDAGHFSAELRANGASHLIRSGTDRAILLLDTATADRLAADIATAQDATRSAQLTSAWAQPGARLAVNVADSQPATIGIAYPAEDRRAGIYYFFTTDTLSGLCRSDIVGGVAFGQTTQGGELIELTPAQADALRARNAGVTEAKAAADAAGLDLIAEYAAVVKTIPADLAAERDRMRATYVRGQLEGGEGYDPYDGWTGPASLALLDQHAPDIAASIRDLRARGL